MRFCIFLQVGLAAGKVLGLPIPSLSVGSMRPNMPEAERRSLMEQQLAMVEGLAAEAKVCV
jgi:hypothetical protein